MRKWVAALILIAFILSGSSYGQAQPKAQDSGELYDAGMAFFHKARYEEAIDRFSKLILFFPTSKLHSYSRYMIGQCYLKMQKYDEALQQFELYLRNFPNGGRVKEAEKGIQTSKEKLKERTSPPSVQPPSLEETEKKKTDEVRILIPNRRVNRRICVQVFDWKNEEFVEGRVDSKKLRYEFSAGIAG